MALGVPGLAAFVLLQIDHSLYVAAGGIPERIAVYPIIAWEAVTGIALLAPRTTTSVWPADAVLSGGLGLEPPGSSSAYECWGEFSPRFGKYSGTRLRIAASSPPAMGLRRHLRNHEGDHQPLHGGARRWCRACPRGRRREPSWPGPRSPQWMIGDSDAVEGC